MSSLIVVGCVSFGLLHDDPAPRDHHGPTRRQLQHEIFCVFLAPHCLLWMAILKVYRTGSAMMTKNLILWPFLGGLFCLGVALYLILDVARRHRGNASMVNLSRAIRLGSREFFKREILVASLLILAVFGLISLAHLWRPRAHLDWTVGIAFLFGAAVSTVAGFIGEAAAVHANSRTAEAARLGGLSHALSVAVSAGAVIHPTRVAISGRTKGPSLFHMMEVLGREETIARLQRALAFIKYE
jgi:Na+/H+-translocating membrane pyrophosphatase